MLSAEQAHSLSTDIQLNSRNRFFWIVLFVTLGHIWLLLAWRFVMPSQEPTPPAPTVKVKFHNNAIQSQSDSEVVAPNGPGFKFVHEFVAKQKKSTADLKRKTISSANLTVNEQPYYDRWQTYIENFGNRLYQRIPDLGKLEGDLELLVAINQDGSLNDVQIRTSSGNLKLDKTALKIVVAAAPFEPLPQEIKKEVDVLEIVRTWQFRAHS